MFIQDAGPSCVSTGSSIAWNRVVQGLPYLGTSAWWKLLPRDIPRNFYGFIYDTVIGCTSFLGSEEKKTLRRAMMWILYNCVINEETYCYQWSFGLRWRNKRFKSTGWIQTCTVLKFWPQVRNNNTCIPWLFCEVSWYEDFYQCEGPSQSSMFNGFLHHKPSIGVPMGTIHFCKPSMATARTGRSGSLHSPELPRA